MSLETMITADLKAAMKAGDKEALRGIRAIKAALLLVQTDGSHEDMTEEKEIKLLQKLVKQRKDSLEIYEKQNREDLASIERAEIAIIEKYLPEAMGPEELRAYLKKLVADLGADSMKDMGRVMGAANAGLSGKADGKSISAVVRDLLQ